MQPMSYKPSRTREERKNAPLYVPENELRQQLEQQANFKRRQKTLEALKEKQEILDHYANMRLPGSESDPELANFLSQKQQELDVLNRQLEAQAPELYMESKEPGSREIKRKEVQAPMFYDNFFSKQQDSESSQGRILSKGEIEREKRLKLREEERMRRLAGVKESAYDNNAKSYLPQSLPSLPGVSHPAEPKEELVLPIHRKQMNMAYDAGAMRSEFEPAFDRRSSIEMHSNMLPALDKKEAERTAMKEMMFGNKEDPFVPKKEFAFAAKIEDKENTPMMNIMPVQEVRQSTSVENKLPPILSEYNKGENVAESQSRGGNREKIEKTFGGNDIFSKLGGGQGQGNLSEAEKKRKYKEDLDAMMKMKKESSVPEGKRNNERRPSYGNIEASRDVRSEANIDSREAPRSLPSIQGEKGRVEREAYAYPMGDRNATDREEKKKKYAEELMQEIVAKEREKEKAKQEKRAQSSAAQNRMQANEGAWSELNVQNRVSESQDRSYDRGVRRDELPPRAVAGGIGNQGKDENSEMEKKRKYKEFLDAQVEERKRREKADMEARQDSRQEVYQSNQGGRGERIERMESREERPSREVERIERVESKAVNYNEAAAPGGFFLHKGEDEEKQRAQLRNQQKLKMAEELKKQMEEKEEMKRREKQKKAEEDLREKERLERDAEQEKRRQQEENQKKQQAEKKNQEYNVQPSVPETQTQHDVKPQYTHVPDDLERPGPDMGGRQAHLERAPYNESREDQYQSRNEQYGAYNRGGFEQNMYPPQHHGGYYPQDNMAPPHQYGEGYGYPPHPHHMQHLGHQQFGGYGMGGNLLQEMANYSMLMQQLMEEKLKIDKIALEEQLVLEQYNNKIKEMRLEKIQYDKEIDKIKKMLHGELPVNASVIGGMDHHTERSHQLDVKLNALNDSYLPALMGLRNAKASHVNHYNRLLAQSQQNFSGQLRGVSNPYQGHNLGVEDTMKSQAFEDSAIFRQSLPGSSDYRPISRAYLENSFQKDLKAYQEARGQNQDNNYNIQSYSNRMLTDNVLQPQQPQQPLKKQATLEKMLDFSTSQPNISEFKAPVTGHEKGMMNEEFGESMILPEVEGTRAKIRKIEQTPQVIYDRTPARLSQEEAPVATQHEIFDLKPGNVSDLKMVEDISQFKLTTPKESNRPTQGDMFKKESQVVQSYAQEPEEMSLKKRLQAVSNEENLQDTLQATQTMEKLKKDVGEMEVKMQEGNAERSLILAEEEEDYNRDDFDAFVESQDQVLEELGIGYAKKGQRKVSRSPKKETAPAIVEKMSKDNKPKTSESQSGSHEKKYGKPKTRDPFAKAMESEMSKSKLAEKKEEQPSEFSKWGEFVMESERKERLTERRENISSVAPREDFEPIKVDESVFPEKQFEKNDETNEAYIEEDIQGSVGKKGKHYGEQFEVEEKLEENDETEGVRQYNKENQTVNVQGRPRKTRELERLGSKKDANASDAYQVKLQSNISHEEEDSKSWMKSITKTRNSNMDLLLGRNSESLASKREAMKAMKAMKNENKAENERRSKNILDRLQRLLDNWGDEANEENNENEKDVQNNVAGSEIGESSELGKVDQSRDLFKPLGIARSYSNRYSQEGEH